MFKVIVAGSRDFNDYTLLSEVLDVYLRSIHDDIQIVSGTAKGADRLGERYAEERGYGPPKRFPADWDNLEAPGAVIKINRFGKKYNVLAGHMRNTEMRDHADAAVIFFHKGSANKGSQDMYDKMKNSGKEVLLSE